MRIEFTVCVEIDPIGKNGELTYEQEIALDELVFRMNDMLNSENLKPYNYRWEEI